MPASTGKATLLGLIGAPLTHSLSPMIHEHWLAAEERDGVYLPLRQAEGDFEALARALRTLDLRGFNATVPYKERLLDAVDELDEAARAIGAVNTVVVEDGRWKGYNTDAAGFVDHLAASAPPVVGRVVVLGAGGAARAVVAGLVGTGSSSGSPASGESPTGSKEDLPSSFRGEDPGEKSPRNRPTEILIFNRTRETAERLVAALSPIAGTVPLRAMRWDERDAAVDGAGLLVNTTSLGMTGQPPLEISLAAMPAEGVVADIVYAPLETPLLRAARARGLVAVDGLGMLTGQAARAYGLWFDRMPEVDAALREKLLTVLAARAAACA